MNRIEYKGIQLFPVYDSEAETFAGEVRIGRQTSYISGESVEALKDGLRDAVDFYESEFGPLKKQKGVGLKKIGSALISA